MISLLAQLVLCALAIGWAGFVLCRSAQRLAMAKGWGQGWVGLALLATVTSLPELASGVSAVTLVDAPNLAVGGALGACVFNLAFLLVVDLLQRKEPIYTAAGASHLLTAAFGVVMLGFVAMSILMGVAAPGLFHLGVYSPLLLLVYLLAVRSVQRHERTLSAGASLVESAAGVDTGREWRAFLLAAGVVAAAGIWLPHLAERLALALALPPSFIGTVLMAVITTLPEAAVTVAALRLRALDMAIGNLLGSNLFNVAVLAIEDAFYLAGPLLAQVRPVHAATAVAATVMSGMVMIGLILRPGGGVLGRVSWVSVALAAAYLLNTALAYVHG